MPQTGERILRYCAMYLPHGSKAEVARITRFFLVTYSSMRVLLTNSAITSLRSSLSYPICLAKS